MKGYRFQVIVYSLIFFLISTVTCTLYPTYAVESTPSASIQQKLEELKTSIASKAAKLKQEISKKLDNRFFTGTLISKTPTSLTLQTKNIIINQDTVYEELGKNLPAGRQERSKFSYKTLAKDNQIAALGEIDDQGFLHAKKIILLKTENLKLKTILWGKIISEEDNLIIIETKDKKRVPVSIAKITAKYKIGDTVIITGYKDKDDILEASFSASVKSLTVSMPRQ